MSDRGYNARDYKIKMVPPGGGEAVTIAAVQGRTINRTKEPVNVSNDDSDGWRKLLAKPGTRAIDLSIEGVATENNFALVTKWYADTFAEITLEDADGNTETGSFFLGNLQHSGAHDGHVAFTAELQSADEIEAAEGS